MLSRTLDSLQTQIDTVYIVANDAEILKELINSQNYIYGVIILILLFIIGFNFWHNNKKIKSELESDLVKMLNEHEEKAKQEVKKYIDSSFSIREKELSESIAGNAGESFRLIASFISDQEDYGTAITWEISAIKKYVNSSMTVGLRYALEDLINLLREGSLTLSKNELYDSLTRFNSMEEIKNIINGLDKHFYDESKSILKYLEQIEKGKADEKKPNKNTSK